MTYKWNSAIALGAMMLIAMPAAAQAGAQGRGQQGLGARPRAALLQEINTQFMNRARNMMGLTEDQMPRFQRVAASWAQKRALLEMDERRITGALGNEYRMGVAANPDSAAKFVDRLNDIRVEYATTFRDEMKELVPVLSPVQRGQFQILRDRFLQQVRELQQKRAAGAAPGPGTP